MLRLGINRFASINSRSIVTKTTQVGKEYGIRSVLSQKIVEHQRRAQKFRAYHGSKAVGEVKVEHTNHATGALKGLDDEPDELGTKTQDATSVMCRLERAFARFEELCQRIEKVPESHFVRIFDYFTRSVEALESQGEIDHDVKINLAVLSGILIRCCGKLMLETPAKAREMLAGNVWQFIKEKDLPLDVSIYNSLIKVFNENQTVVEPQTLLDEMKSSNLQPDRITYQRLIHQYCSQNNVTSALSLLEEMKENNMKLDEATFASLMLGYSMQDNPPSIDEMFELMKANGFEPGSRSFAAAILSQARLLKKDASKATEELTRLQQMIRDYDTLFSVNEIGDILSELVSLKEHAIVNSTMDFLIKSVSSNKNSRERLVSLLIGLGQLQEASNLFWSSNSKPNARNSGNFGHYYIRLLASGKNIPMDHVMAECSRLVSTNMNVNAFQHLYYLSAAAGNLTLVRAALKKIGESEFLKVQYYWPLLAQAKSSDEILNVLKNDMNPKMNPSGLVETFSRWVWPWFSENPSVLLELNKNDLKYDPTVLTASYLYKCGASKKIEDAVKFIKEVPIQEASDQQHQDEPAKVEEDIEQEDVDDMGNQEHSLGFGRINPIGRLLNQIREQTRDPAIVDKAFALCKIPGLKIKSEILSPLIKVRLEQADGFNTALECFLDIAEKYNLTPNKNDLIMCCLEKKDSQSLQKIMDTSSKIYGETNSLFDLACCLIRCGKMKQANKVLSSPGFRINTSRIYRACKRLATGNQENLDVVEHFVYATKELPEVNQDYLYEILLDAYEKSGNHGRALDLWNRMQEEDFRPSRKVLIHMARVLEKTNITVPFKVPKDYSSIQG